MIPGATRFLPFYLATSLLVLAGCIGCSKEDGGVPSLRTMNFGLTDSLLSPGISDSMLGISFRPPKGWESVAQETIEELMAKTGVRSAIPMPAGRAFRDSTTNALLFVAALDTLNAIRGDSVLQRYVEFYRRMNDSSRVQTDVFKKDAFIVRQLLLMSPSSVLFKMIFEQPTPDLFPFEFNFAIPRHAYVHHAKTIESVMASVQIHRSTHIQ